MPSDGVKQNGWNEYSRLVLKELETLSEGMSEIKSDLQDVKHEITKLQAREDQVNDLKDWKKKIDDIVSPSQLKEAIIEVDDMKMFKTRAITVFAVVQFFMAVFAIAVRLYK